MPRRLATLLLLALSVAALSGCVAISGIATSQPDVGESIRIQVTLCANDVADPAVEHAGCQHESTSTQRFKDALTEPGEVEDGDYQLLLGLRVPAGTEAPATLSTSAGVPLAFTRSASYEEGLQRLVPAGANRVWLGYVSDMYSLSYAAGDPARETTVAASLGLPRPADGSPYAEPFRYRVVAGGRVVDDPTSPPPADPGIPAPSDPVACGDDLVGFVTSCVDSPLESQLATDFPFDASDAGIVAGAATASPGQAVALPFFVRVAGDPGVGKTASLTVSTTLPGAGAVPQRTSVPLAQNGNERVEVPISVPGNATPGDYEVRLTAQLPGGSLRGTAARLTVRPRPVAPDSTKPRIVGLRLSRGTFRAGKGKRRGTRISYRLSEAATVRFAVQRCARGKGRRCRRPKPVGAVTKRGRAGRNGFLFRGIVKGGKLRPGRYRFSIVATDAAGNRTVALRVPFAVRR